MTHVRLELYHEEGQAYIVDASYTRPANARQERSAKFAAWHGVPVKHTDSCIARRHSPVSHPSVRGHRVIAHSEAARAFWSLLSALQAV